MTTTRTITGLSAHPISNGVVHYDDVVARRSRSSRRRPWNRTTRVGGDLSSRPRSPR